MIVIKRVDQIEVDVNEDFDVVLRQTDAHGEESIVWIPHGSVDAVCRAMREKAEEARTYEADFGED